MVAGPIKGLTQFYLLASDKTTLRLSKQELDSDNGKPDAAKTATGTGDGTTDADNNGETTKIEPTGTEDGTNTAD